ncbi:DNA polymerase III subunit gamma/tau [Buchnera aphidicola (Muscaphis stroyani)]|uniref:DNA polymerase III subunit gamma/tau n=1 Tax=Buchnera aphidicola (Muscaphis stroyani) TaxID=1241869 RepID=A0A4D6Y544_9GAMM|nr:DNA polymerase III subunit gamma/tau [Buchnera aphidicola]QCI24517.1 DNA polymerase III subunit gamma/tau [Buchnera aphidicola (Muscaphis stroyani)]
MNYEILARKWRPQSFQDIIGQKNIVSAVSNGLSLGRVHHAWLFSGARGVGKTTISRLLAKSLNCKEGITAAPCRKCDICQDIEKGLCLDFIEIDAASRTKVEDIKEILDNIYYFPNKGRFKIYLIDEVHMLSRHSFNALLKTLEEPPKHVKFILATTDVDKIPKTIISRCLYFNLQLLSEENIFKHIKKILVKENIDFHENALKTISYYAQGSMRDALNLIEQAIQLGKGYISFNKVTEMLGIPTQKQSFLLTEALLNKNFKKIIFLLNEISHTGISWEKILIEMLHFLHHIAMLQSFPLIWEENQVKNFKYKINSIAKKTKKSDIQLCYKILLNGIKELEFAPSQKIGVEMTLLRAINEI